MPGRALRGPAFKVLPQIRPRRRVAPFTPETADPSGPPTTQSSKPATECNIATAIGGGRCGPNGPGPGRRTAVQASQPGDGRSWRPANRGRWSDRTRCEARMPGRRRPSSPSGRPGVARRDQAFEDPPSGMPAGGIAGPAHSRMPEGEPRPAAQPACRDQLPPRHQMDLLLAQAAGRKSTRSMTNLVQPSRLDRPLTTACVTTIARHHSDGCRSGRKRSSGWLFARRRDRCGRRGAAGRGRAERSITEGVGGSELGNGVTK
jgi:hypothetical protein